MNTTEAQERQTAAGKGWKARALDQPSPAHHAGPSSEQLLLPLLDELQQAGGRATPGELYERLAARLDVPAEVLEATKTFGDGSTRSLWERKVRWTRQTAVLKGLLASPEKGVWELTAAGSCALMKAKPGLILAIFETDNGVALWASAEDAAGVIEKSSISLIFTSPLYPIANPRAYGGMRVTEWLWWMRHLGGLWKDLLTEDGSIMVNVGQVCTPGAPTQSIYIEKYVIMMVEELGYHLADRKAWFNPSKLPSPMPWVAKKRVRCKPSLEPVLWFSKNPHCKADNRKVLEPYAQSTLKHFIGKPGKKMTRASGYTFGETSWSKDNGGKIPSNLIVAKHGGGPRGYYRERCRETGLPEHPAMFPDAVPERGILLTTDIGDVVYDPMAGSGKTAEVAERLGRRWITSEKALAYVLGESFRFEQLPSFRMHPLPAGL